MRPTTFTILALLSCTSPTAPPPTGPNATMETEKGLMWVVVPMAEVEGSPGTKARG